MKLLDQVRRACRTKHLSLSTEQAYVGWTRRYVRYHGLRHPHELTEADVQAFLSYLAAERGVAASTQNQALAALLVAETVALTALARGESRGAHQREDLPDADPALERNQIVRLDGDGNPVTDWADVVRAEYDLAPVEAAE